MNRTGPGPASAAASVVIISGTGGPYTATWSATGGLGLSPTGDLDVDTSVTLGVLDSKSGLLFAQVTDHNNGGVSGGGVPWSAQSS